MLIVYESFTGNVRRFINKLNTRSIELNEDLVTNEPFVLITYTIGYGEVPKKTRSFLSNNKHNIKAVVVSGNIIWGDNYGKAGETISSEYNVPLLMKFELSGTNSDVIKFKEKVDELNED